MNLHPYQQALVDSAPARWGIWAKPGTGKTAMTISLAIRHECASVLVITTKSLKANWLREFYMWDPKGLLNPLILTKEEFKKRHASLGRLDAVIFDEAHYGAYPTNQIHKAFVACVRATNPRCIWLATATPILSDPMSVFGLSVLMERPLMKWQEFRYKYFRKVPMGMRDVWLPRPMMQEELARDLQLIGTPISIPDSHPISHEYEYFPMLPAQEKAVERLDEDPTTANPIVWANKVLQISNGTLKLPQGGYEAILCLKLARLLELVEQNPKLLIVCRQTAELEMLRDRIPNARIYNGATSPEERDEIVLAANAGECVMLLQAECGVGFNLPDIRLVVFYSHSWSFVSYEQSLGRNGGLRQKGPNAYIHLITEGTPDASVMECLERKKSFDAELYRASRITSFPS